MEQLQPLGLDRGFSVRRPPCTTQQQMNQLQPLAQQNQQQPLALMSPVGIVPRRLLLPTPATTRETSTQPLARQNQKLSPRHKQNH